MGVAPASPQPSNIVGGDNALSPLAWTLPNVTGSNYSVYVESLNGLNARNSYATGPVFAIDASLPSAYLLSGSSNSVRLGWTPSSDYGYAALIGYRVYRSDSLLALSSSTSFTDTSVRPGTIYDYHVQVYDQFGATNSRLLAVTTPQVSAPATTTKPKSPAAPANSTNKALLPATTPDATTSLATAPAPESSNAARSSSESDRVLSERPSKVALGAAHLGLTNGHKLVRVMVLTAGSVVAACLALIALMAVLTSTLAKDLAVTRWLARKPWARSAREWYVAATKSLKRKARALGKFVKAKASHGCPEKGKPVAKHHEHKH